MQENNILAISLELLKGNAPQQPSANLSNQNPEHSATENSIKVAGKRKRDKDTFSAPEPSGKVQKWITAEDTSRDESKDDSNKSDKGSNNGRWSKEEHKRFITALEKFGKNWKKVEAFVASRSGTQVRSHAQKYFLKAESNKFRDLSEHDSESATPTVITRISPDKVEVETNADQKRPLNNISTIQPKIASLENKLNSALDQLKVLASSTGNIYGLLLPLRQEFVGIAESTFGVSAEAKDDRESLEKCAKVIEAARYGISETDINIQRFSPQKPNECRFLVKLMNKYGYDTLEEIEADYTTLSDWVDTSSSFKSSEKKTELEISGRIAVNNPATSLSVIQANGSM